MTAPHTMVGNGGQFQLKVGLPLAGLDEVLVFLGDSPTSPFAFRLLPTAAFLSLLRPPVSAAPVLVSAPQLDAARCASPDALPTLFFPVFVACFPTFSSDFLFAFFVVLHGFTATLSFFELAPA